MQAPYHDFSAANGTPASQPDSTTPSTGRDFITPDGRLVPRALGEAGLRQRTALLVGGMLIGRWPEHL